MPSRFIIGALSVFLEVEQLLCQGLMMPHVMGNAARAMGPSDLSLGKPWAQTRLVWSQVPSCARHTLFHVYFCPPLSLPCSRGQ